MTPKEALFKSVTPAKAGVLFVEFSGSALPSDGVRPVLSLPKGRNDEF
jgi:hypothetical protein